VDVVEVVVGVRPGELGIVKFKFAVGRDPEGLGRGDVGAGNFGGWELVGKISATGKMGWMLLLLSLLVIRKERKVGVSHCPDTRSRTDINHSLRVIADRSMVELVIHRNEEHLVAGNSNYQLSISA